MWTLVLFTMLVNGNTGGGVNSTVTLLEFNSEATCMAAANALSDRGSDKDQPSTHYVIFGKCIQRSSVRGRF